MSSPLILSLSFSTVSSILLFVGGWACFGVQYKHTLSALLCMEISLVGVLGASCCCKVLSGHYFFFILSLGVCEAALGLSILVLYARHYGNDQFSGLNSSAV